MQGAIGVLDRTQMDHFADIFLAYQKRGKATDQDGKSLPGIHAGKGGGVDYLCAEITKLNAQLEPWTGPNGPGKKRADVGLNGFSIKCDVCNFLWQTLTYGTIESLESLTPSALLDCLKNCPCRTRS